MQARERIFVDSGSYRQLLHGALQARPIGSARMIRDLFRAPGHAPTTRAEVGIEVHCREPVMRDTNMAIRVGRQVLQLCEYEYGTWLAWPAFACAGVVRAAGRGTF